MAYTKIQFQIFESGSSVTPANGAVCTITDKETGLLAVTYSDRNGGASLGNPIVTGSDGLLSFYADASRFDIDVVHSSGTQSFDDYLAPDDQIIVGPKSRLEFDTLADAIAGNASNSLDRAVDWGDVTASGTLAPEISVKYNNLTSKAGGANYIVKTLAQAATDGDTIGGDGVAGKNHAIDATYCIVMNTKSYTADSLGLIEGITQNNTIAYANLCRNVESGDTVDFSGKEYRIFEGVTGEPSSSATPGTTIAVSSSELPLIQSVSGVVLKNGTVYAADQATAGVKSYYPCTLSLYNCTSVNIEGLNLESKGESYGDADASLPLSDPDRVTFLPYNSGVPLMVIACDKTSISSIDARLCGSVGCIYVSSSQGTLITNCFSNPASLGYAAYAFDSWVGPASLYGWSSHDAVLQVCRAYKEVLTTRDTLVGVGSTLYSSKGCVACEDSEVNVSIQGGHYADAYPNGGSVDIGYAFMANSCTVNVNGATVDNCANIGTCDVSNADYSYLTVSNVEAKNLRKTVHQNRSNSFSRYHFKYTNVQAEVVGGGVWPGNGNLSNEETSYFAAVNTGNRWHGKFTDCDFRGATYAAISDSQAFGSLFFTGCDIETNGFLYSIDGIGGGAATQKKDRGVIFDNCAIEDVSSVTTPYSVWSSTTLYVYVDLSTSTVRLNSVRDMESSTITTPSTFVNLYKMPREDANIETITAAKTLKPESARKQTITPSGAIRNLNLLRSDKYKFEEFRVSVPSAASFSLVLKDYTGATTIGTVAPGESVLAWNDGVNYYVSR